MLVPIIIYQHVFNRENCEFRYQTDKQTGFPSKFQTNAIFPNQMHSNQMNSIFKEREYIDFLKTLYRNLRKLILLKYIN